jgi:enoyl-CoA hydratase/carnithine racemase
VVSDEQGGYCRTVAFRTIYSCPKPAVAQVQRDAYGGGVGLIAATDIAIAAETSRFSLSEVKLALIAATISPYVIRVIGEHRIEYFRSACGINFHGIRLIMRLTKEVETLHEQLRFFHQV